MKFEIVACPLGRHFFLCKRGVRVFCVHRGSAFLHLDYMLVAVFRCHDDDNDGKQFGRLPRPLENVLTLREQTKGSFSFSSSVIHK